MEYIRLKIGVIQEKWNIELEYVARWLAVIGALFGALLLVHFDPHYYSD